MTNMPRNDKLYDRLFWCLATASLFFYAWSLTGCGGTDAFIKALNQPTPTGTVLDDGLSSIPKVVANPFDFPSWAKIITTLGVGGGALFGIRQHRKRKARRAASSETPLA